MKLEKGFKEFLWKTGVFVLLFIIFSGIVGVAVFSNGLLGTWKIDIYGRVGYILLFSMAGFILLYRKRLTEFSVYKRKTRDNLFIGLAFALLIVFYFVSKNINQLNPNFINILWFHALALSGFVFLVLGVYGFGFVKDFVKKFKKELGYFLVFGIIVYSFMKAVWSLWPYLSLGVLESIKFLLKLIGVQVNILGPASISVNGFAVEIAEACSGVYSIFIFSALYLFIVFLDWDKMNKKKAGILFIPAVLGAFAFNILRVFVLMLVGAFISRSLALGMYHSYAGMVFFLIYFLLFWGLLYKWMKR